jgi:hypothetical protein
MFVARPFSELVEEVFSNDIIRSFMLTVTDKVSIHSSTLDFKQHEIIEVLVNGLEFTHSNYGELNMYPTPIKQTLLIEEGCYHSLLMQNFWLVVLILYILS